MVQYVHLRWTYSLKRDTRAPGDIARGSVQEEGEEDMGGEDAAAAADDDDDDDEGEEGEEGEEGGDEGEEGKVRTVSSPGLRRWESSPA